jgi:acid phosphatase (class A)
MRIVSVFLALLLAGAMIGAAAAKPTLDIDASHLLPPPPADGSPAAKAELAEVEQAVAERTPDALAQATSDDGTEDPTIYRGVIGDGFDLEKLPATAKMLADVMSAQRAAASKAKDFFKRVRPWVADPDLKTCGPRGINWHTSYPSGHATMGYSVGVILAAAVPDKAQAILMRANGYAENRLVCGMHFRSDIVAGEVLGTAVALTLMHDAAFKAEFDAAEQELKAAHVTQ